MAGALDLFGLRVKLLRTELLDLLTNHLGISLELGNHGELVRIREAHLPEIREVPGHPRVHGAA